VSQTRVPSLALGILDFRRLAQGRGHGSLTRVPLARGLRLVTGSTACPTGQGSLVVRGLAYQCSDAPITGMGSGARPLRSRVSA
jgi:hypothetical protein